GICAVRCLSRTGRCPSVTHRTAQMPAPGPRVSARKTLEPEARLGAGRRDTRRTSTPRTRSRATRVARAPNLARCAPIVRGGVRRRQYRAGMEHGGAPPTRAVAPIRWGIPDAAIAWFLSIGVALVALAPFV